MKKIKNIFKKKRIHLGTSKLFDNNEFSFKKNLSNILTKSDCEKIYLESKNKNIFPSLNTTKVYNIKKQEIIKNFKLNPKEKKDFAINLNKCKNKKL